MTLSPVPQKLAPTAPPRSARWAVPAALALLLVLLIVGAWLRFHRIDRESQWVDEFWSVYISTGRGDQVFDLPRGVVMDPPPPIGLDGAPPWTAVWTGMDAAVHPPLYHIALRWWMDAFGEGDRATRGFSAVLSLAGVAVLFDAVRRRGGLAVALAAAAIMCFAVGQIDQSQQTRSYTLLALTGLLACHAMIRIETGGATWGRLTQLALASIAAALTHYFSAGAIVALGVYAAIVLRGRDRARTVLVMVAAPFLAMAVWGPQLLHQYHRGLFRLTTGWLLETPSVSSHAIVRAVDLSASHVLGRTQWPLPLATVCLVYLLPPILVKARPQTLLWWFWTMGSIGVLTVFDMVMHGQITAQERYTFIANPAICAILAYPLPLRGKKWLGAMVPVLLVASAAVAAVSRVQSGQRFNGDWRALAGEVRRLVPAREPLVFYAGKSWSTPAFWYMGYAHYQPNAAHPIIFLDQAADAKTLAMLWARFPRVWLVGQTPRADGPHLLSGWTDTDMGSSISQTGGVEGFSRPELRPNERN